MKINEIQHKNKICFIDGGNKCSLYQSKIHEMKKLIEQWPSQIVAFTRQSQIDSAQNMESKFQ